MARITSEMIRQIMLTADANLDPNFPPEKLALFDEDGTFLDLTDIPLRFRLAVLSNWKGEWSEDTAYDEGSLVRYNSSLYLATNNVAADAVAPDAPGDTLWAFLAGGAGGGGGGFYEAWKDEWSEEASYIQGDVVRFGGALYMAATTIEPASVLPDEADASTWIFLLLGGGVGGGTDSNAMHFRWGWENNTPYSFGDVVLDGGGLYVLTSSEAPAFGTAPSAEDPETALWTKIANVT